MIKRTCVIRITPHQNLSGGSERNTAEYVYADYTESLSRTPVSSITQPDRLQRIEIVNSL